MLHSSQLCQVEPLYQPDLQQHKLRKELPCGHRGGANNRKGRWWEGYFLLALGHRDVIAKHRMRLELKDCCDYLFGRFVQLINKIGVREHLL